MSYIKKRAFDFDVFKQILDKYILLKNQNCLEHIESTTKLFPNGKRQQDCVLCQLPVYKNEYEVYKNENEIICSDCYYKYIDDNNRRLYEITDFEEKVTRSNAKIENLNNQMQSNSDFLPSESLLTDTFKGLSLKEVEHALGYPINYGDFDRGLASGFWNINKSKYEIWFQDLVCTKVTFRNQNDETEPIYVATNSTNQKSIGLHILKRFGIFLSVCIGFSFLFKKIYEPYNRTSIMGSDSDWLLIIFNFIFIVIFFFFLLIEAFKFKDSQIKYRYANLVMMFVLILFVFSALFF